MSGQKTTVIVGKKASPEEAEKEEEEKKPEKVYLLNAIWFKGKGGAALYREYLAAASPIAEEYGAKRVEGLIPVEIIKGDFKPSYIFVVEWPSLDQYYEFIKNPRYRAAAQMLTDAVEKSVVLSCRRF